MRTAGTIRLLAECIITAYPGFPFCAPNQDLYTPTLSQNGQISSSHVVPLPTAVSSGRPGCGTAGRPWFQGCFSDTSPPLPRSVTRMSSVGGWPLSSGHRQRPDPPQHVAEQPPGQMTFHQQEPVVSRMLHQPASGFHQPLLEPGFPFCPPNQGLYTQTRLSAHQISSSHIVPLPAEAALDVEPTRAPAFRAFLRHRSTLMLFLRRSSAGQRSPAIRPALAAPRSSAACRRTAAG